MSEGPPERTIYSLGTSNRTAEEFIRLLQSYKVTMAIDVRSFPTSQFPHFRREALESCLRKQGIGYTYLGKELGGYRKEGYEAFRQTDAFLRGLEILEGLAMNERSAFFCAERLPWRCHRRWIGESLQSRGWKVFHLIDGQRVWEPKPRQELGSNERLDGRGGTDGGKGKDRQSGVSLSYAHDRRGCGGRWQD